MCFHRRCIILVPHTPPNLLQFWLILGRLSGGGVVRDYPTPCGAGLCLSRFSLFQHFLGGIVWNILSESVSIHNPPMLKDGEMLALLAWVDCDRASLGTSFTEHHDNALICGLPVLRDQEIISLARWTGRN